MVFREPLRSPFWSHKHHRVSDGPDWGPEGRSPAQPSLTRGQEFENGARRKSEFGCKPGDRGARGEGSGYKTLEPELGRRIPCRMPSGHQWLLLSGKVPMPLLLHLIQAVKPASSTSTTLSTNWSLISPGCPLPGPTHHGDPGKRQSPKVYWMRTERTKVQHEMKSLWLETS